MKAIFVTGTDTGAGKSVITGLIARYFKEKGCKVITQKWIQTGSSYLNFSSDIKLHLKIMGSQKNDITDYLAWVCPFIFKTACSPHLASKIEKRRIEVSKIKKAFRRLAKNFDFVIVEGIGGLLVPFDRSRFLIDIVKELDLPVLVVAQNKLGTINHTLLTVEALRSRNLKILGIVFNNLRGQKRLILKDNPGIVRLFSKQKIFGVLPWQKNFSQLYKSFILIGNRIWRETGLKEI